MADLESWLRLLYIPRLGVARRAQLIRSFKTANRIFRADPSDISAAVPSISLSLARKIQSYNCYNEVIRQIQFMRKNGISLVTCIDKNFPVNLKNIPYAPIILFYKGCLTDTKNSLGVIGSRRPLNYSVSTSRFMISDLAARTSLPIVSGLALGIDAIAHKEALKHTLPVIGVLAFGFDTFYPAANKALARKILDSEGILFTEYPAFTPLTRNNFLERNRIIAGISRGILIIQAALQSGSMKTAFMALDYNRDLFVVPYRFDSPWFTGSHRLIQQGAVLCCKIQDILREWHITDKDTPQKATIELSCLEKKIYENISRDISSIDTLLNDLECDFMELSEALINMEIKGVIRKDISGQYSIIPCN